MRRPLIAVAVALAATIGLAGCSAASNGSSGSVAGPAVPAPRSGGDGNGAVADSAGGAAKSEGTASKDRAVVITGEAIVAVGDPIAAAADATRIVTAAGGRVDGRSEQAGGGGSGATATLTLRIPAAKLDATLDALRKLGRADRVTTNSSDVTGQTQDLDARITALRTTIQRMLELGSELATLFRRRRTIAMLAALALVPILIAVAVRVTGAGSSGRGPAFLSDITHNGLFVAFTALVASIPLFLPLTIGVVAGDTIAGEASLGTLRALLIAPAGRLRLLIIKYIGALTFTAAATAVIVLAGVASGAALFPVGDVILLSGESIGAGEFAARVTLLVLYVVLSLSGLCAIGLFISTLTTIPVGAMAATVVLAGASQIADALPQLDAVHAYLPSHYWLGFGDLLRAPLVWDSFVQNGWLQLGYVVVFGGLAAWRFLTKDVLS